MLFHFHKWIRFDNIVEEDAYKLHCLGIYRYCSECRKWQERVGEYYKNNWVNCSQPSSFKDEYYELGK